MPRFCSSCGSQMYDAATTCPSCNKAVSVGGGAAAAPAADSGSGMAQNVAGALAYVTLIPAIIFLVAAPYNQNKFIKFNSLQNIFLCGAGIVVWIGLMILASAAVIGIR